MALDIESLRRHYESLTDEALEEIDPEDLTEAARKCYESELAKRQSAEDDGEPPAIEELEENPEVEPDWLTDAALAVSFAATSSDRGVDAEHAKNVLLAAGVPCHISATEPDPDNTGSPYGEFRVLVPSALDLKATAVLDKEIFNPELEENWRAHFSTVSDAELRALRPEVICAGMRDRIERLTRIYNEEIARRRSG